MRRAVFTFAALVTCYASARAGLPSGWSDTDIGTNIAGTATYSAGAFTMVGEGTTLYGTADSIYFVHRQISGDFQITARLASETLDTAWAKAGVTCRRSLNANSAHVTTTFAQNNGIYCFYRPSTSSTTTATKDTANSYAAACYLRLTRIGDNFTCSASLNGSTWIDVGTPSVTMSDPVYIGFCMATYNAWNTETVVFDNVTITYPPGAFTLISPTNGATGQPLTPTLQWTASTDATSYALLVDDNIGFGSPVVNEPALATNSYAIGAGVLLTDVVYYWRVTASFGPFTTPASNNDFNFRTGGGTSPPGVFTLASPGDGATGVSLTATLDWTTSSGATTYALLVDDDPAFTSPEIDEPSLGSSSYTMVAGDVVDSATYYWRVTATNANGTTPASNNDFSFTTVVPPPPGAFWLTAPTNGTSGVSLTTTLDWTNSANATSYALLVDDDPAFGSPEIDAPSLATSEYSVTAGELWGSTTYYWRVTAANGVGTTAAANNDFSFTTDVAPAPYAFSLLSPPDTTEDVSTTVTFDWEDATFATSYALLVDDDPAFASPEIDQSSLTDSSYTAAGELEPEVTYYWRVSASNGVFPAVQTTWASNNDFAFTTGLPMGYVGHGCAQSPRAHDAGAMLVCAALVAAALVRRRRSERTTAR